MTFINMLNREQILCDRSENSFEQRNLLHRKQWFYPKNLMIRYHEVDPFVGDQSDNLMISHELIDLGKY